MKHNEVMMLKKMVGLFLLIQVAGLVHAAHRVPDFDQIVQKTPLLEGYSSEGIDKVLYFFVTHLLFEYNFQPESLLARKEWLETNYNYEISKMRRAFPRDLKFFEDEAMWRFSFIEEAVSKYNTLSEENPEYEGDIKLDSYIEEVLNTPLGNVIATPESIDPSYKGKKYVHVYGIVPSFDAGEIAPNNFLVNDSNNQSGQSDSIDYDPEDGVVPFYEENE